MIWPVILSGGSGTRLWPLSRLERPKQLLALAGDRTMVQATAQRTADPSRFNPPLVVANEAHKSAILDQLDAVNIRPQALILEPIGRNTAPAIALAAEHIAASDPQGLLLVMPSDHVIADTAAFLAAVEALTPFVRDGWLATFGIRAATPETGYGYIRLGEALGDGVHAVRRFVEKPDRPTAEDYIASGDYAWNGGIFLMRSDRYLDALAANAPAIRSSVAEAMRAATREGDVLRPDPGIFADCPSDSIDYAVMEKDDRVAVVRVDMGWSDIGSWDALWEVSSKDEAGNAAQGDVMAVDARNCLVRSGGPLVALVGVEDLTIVADRDAVLVAGRGRGQDVKKIVDRLAAEKRTEQVRPVEVARSRGTERVLAASRGAEVRLLTLAPGARRELASPARFTLLAGEAALNDGEPLACGVQVAGARGDVLRNTGSEASDLIELWFADPPAHG